MGLKLAWYGDDFTGASDTLATLAQAGLRARLFLGVPSDDDLSRAGELDAIGIAGAARAMAPQEMQEALQPVARFFQSCGAPVLHYKCCSTFDSAPERGSIGQAVRVLRGAVTGSPVFIVGGQPSLGRYCAFGQLFATERAGGPVVRIDRHATMSRHPSTPMNEADLRVHLQRQGLGRIALIDLRAHAQDPASRDAALNAVMAQASSDAFDAVLFDVVSEQQLRTIGQWLWERPGASPRLCVGASSVAQALVDHWGLLRHGRSGLLERASGPVLAFAGSLSPQTARQVAHASSYERVALDAGRVAAGDARYVDETVVAIVSRLREGTHVLVTTSPPGIAATSPVLLRELGPNGGALLRRVLMATPVSRLGIAGGDTSSHALQALAPTSLEWMACPANGVAMCRVHAGESWLDCLEVMLKGGQMGDDSLFETLVHGHAASGDTAGDVSSGSGTLGRS